MAGFEGIEARVHEAVFRRMSNASVFSEETVLHLDQTFRGIFEEPDAMLDVVAMNSKVLRYPAQFILAMGERVQINGVEYTVATTPLRDASGLEASVQVVPL